MACQNCHKIRAAILHGRMAEAAGLTVDALREKIGWAAPVAVPTDPETLDGKTKAELLEIAAAEGVAVDESATKAVIIEAITAHRLSVPA